MATVLETPATALVPVAENPAAAVVLFDTAKFDAFYAKLKADIEATPVDLTTDKGRKAIASAAHKVRTEKATIDRDRKRLTQEWRDMTSQVNTAWKGIEAQLDGLFTEARKPLTEWEAAEEQRVTWCRTVITDLKAGAVVTMDDTAETVRARGKAAWEVLLKPETFGDMLDEAVAAKDTAVANLKAALARLTQEEADRAELQRLRDEAAAREEADRIAEEAAEAKRLADAKIEADRIAAEQAKAEEERQAEIAEERRIANEQAEAKRIEDAKAEAAALAERQAQAAAKAEQDKRDAEHARQLAEAQEERDRIAAREAERVAEQDAAAAEQAKRDKNRAHRAQIMGQAKIAIMAAANEGHAVEHPITEAAAVAIVKAIVNGFIPNVTLRF